ncbi:MAG: NAD(+)/NADH kinase [Oscillospiraceae bacterium]|jgi:NAD+ kinase|nr:NAD(+)/NADH kinase [Oscillospiraceae bacterium]
MKKIIIFSNTKRDPDKLMAKRLEEYLGSLGASSQIITPGANGGDFDIPDEAFEDAEMLICLGGDGTMLHLSRKAAVHEMPMLGVNMGHMGFITQLEPDETDRLEEIVTVGYDIEKRMMIDIDVMRGSKRVYSSFGLNEAVVTRNNPAHAIRLTAYGDGRKISDYSGDGIIIATPTGSTAYSMSAGGPIVEPTAEILILTPMCAHSLIAKAYVLTGDRVTSVKVTSFDDNDAVLMVDGGTPFPLELGDVVYVRKSEHVTRLVKVTSNSFYDIVKNKLNQ